MRPRLERNDTIAISIYGNARPNKRDCYTRHHFALENPIPHKYAVQDIAHKKGISKYHQLIQPYQFGHIEKKATCLWLYGLPELKPTNNVYSEMMKLDYKDRAKIHYASPGPERKKLRSKTYPGIAAAIASQWGEFLTPATNRD